MIRLAMALGLLLFVYWPVLLKGSLLKRDDLWILDHLKSPMEIIRRVSTGEWNAPWVHQPLRDWTLYFDRALTASLGASTYHWTNLTIWIAIVWGMHALLRTVCPLLERQARFAWVVAFAVHPVFVGSVAWTSARKHLLTMLCIECATLLWLKRKRRSAYGLYFTALFAHPIAVLWPCWTVLDQWLTEKKISRAAYAWVMVALLAALINYRHYTTSYVSYLGVEKVAGEGLLAFAASLLAHGRYFFNLIAPFQLSAVYRPSTGQNVLGLLTLIGFFFLMFRSVPKSFALSWGLYYFLPLLPVTLRMTNVFASDTYILVSAIGFWVLLVKAFETRVRSDRAVLVPVLLCLMFVPAARLQAGTWVNDLAIWENAWKREPSPRAASALAAELIAVGRFREAVDVSAQLIDWEPRNPEGYAFASNAIFLDRKLTLAARAEGLRKILALPNGFAWAQYHLGLLEAETGNLRAAAEDFTASLEKCHLLGRAAPSVASDMISFCRSKLNEIQDCTTLEASARLNCQRFPD